MSVLNDLQASKFHGILFFLPYIMLYHNIPRIFYFRKTFYNYII